MGILKMGWITGSKEGLIKCHLYSTATDCRRLLKSMSDEDLQADQYSLLISNRNVAPSSRPSTPLPRTGIPTVQLPPLLSSCFEWTSSSRYDGRTTSHVNVDDRSTGTYGTPNQRPQSQSSSSRSSCWWW
jgi:hypothetical protein